VEGSAQAFTAILGADLPKTPRFRNDQAEFLFLKYPAIPLGKIIKGKIGDLIIHHAGIFPAPDEAAGQWIEPILTPLADLPPDLLKHLFRKARSDKHRDGPPDPGEPASEGQKPGGESPPKESSPLDNLVSGQDPVGPNLDFWGDRGHVTVFLPGKLAAVGAERKDPYDPFLITSDRGFFPFGSAELEQLGIIFKGTPHYFLNGSRWSPDYLKQFLAGGTVEPGILFQMLGGMFRDLMELPEDVYDLISLWTVGTYLFPIFETIPYLSISGESGSGKTKQLSILENLVFNPVISANISSATIYRALETTRGTLLLDEADTIGDRALWRAAENILNSGYKKGMPVLRTLPGGNTEALDCYGPKAIASLNGLQGPLANRCLPVRLLRNNGDISRRSVADPKYDWARCRHLLYSFALSRYKEVREVYHDQKTWEGVPLRGRPFELFRPILAIAAVFDKNGCEGLFANQVSHAQRITAEAQVINLSLETRLFLESIRSFAIAPRMEIGTRPIAEKMTDLADGEIKRPKGKWVGQQLRKFGLVESDRIVGGIYRYKIRKDKVDDVCTRYLPPEEDAT
jgi:hypothetical protein